VLFPLRLNGERFWGAEGSGGEFPQPIILFEVGSKQRGISWLQLVSNYNGLGFSVISFLIKFKMPTFPSLSRRFSSLSLLFAALVALTAKAQNPPLPAALPEDLFPELKQILQTALQQSPTMLARSISISKSEADRLVSASALWPTLGGSVQYADTRTTLSSKQSTTTRTDGPLYNVYASQPIYYWGTLKAQADIGKLEIKIAEHQYAEAYRTLILTLRTQYLALIQKKALLRNARYAQQIAESNLQLLENRLKNGSVSPGAVNMPRLEAAEAKLNTERSEEDYNSSRLALAHLAGMDDVPDATVPIEIPKPTFASETIVGFFETLKGEGTDNLFTAMVYKDTIKENELNYKIAKYRLYPKFSFTPQVSQSNLNTLTGGGVVAQAITTTTIAATANWTIFDGFATRGAKLSALATKRLSERYLKNFNEATADTARALEKQILFAGRIMDLRETRSALAGAAVKQIGDNVKLGTDSQNNLDRETLNYNSLQLGAMAARGDFLSRWGEYVSLLGVDPALNNLPSRYLHYGK